MLEYVLEITCFKKQTCLISKELKRWEIVFYMSYDTSYNLLLM